MNIRTSWQWLDDGSNIPYATAKLEDLKRSMTLNIEDLIGNALEHGGPRPTHPAEESRSHYHRRVIAGAASIVMGEGED